MSVNPVMPLCTVASVPWQGLSAPLKGVRATLEAHAAQQAELLGGLQAGPFFRRRAPHRPRVGGGPAQPAAFFLSSGNHPPPTDFFLLNRFYRILMGGGIPAGSLFPAIRHFAHRRLDPPRGGRGFKKGPGFKSSGARWRSFRYLTLQTTPQCLSSALPTNRARKTEPLAPFPDKIKERNKTGIGFFARVFVSVICKSGLNS